MYTKLWLDYETNDSGVSVLSDDSFSEDRKVQNAVKELKHCRLLKNKTVRLQMVRDERLLDEGYHIFGNDPEYTVEASSETGLLYGTFRLISLLGWASGKCVKCQQTGCGC